MKFDQIDYLHPVMHKPIEALIMRLGHERIPLVPYETVRSPWRQAQLYAQGRVIAGKKVTNARAWASFHQYGFAVDFVFRIGGKWQWTEPEQGQWTRFHELAKAVGLNPLSFEKPHVQLSGVALSQFQHGDFPSCGLGSVWWRWLEEQMELWGSSPRVENGLTHPGAPPLPGISDRPEVPAEHP